MGFGERQAQRQPDHADTLLCALNQKYESQFSSLVFSPFCTDSQLFSMPGIGRASPLRYDSFKCTEVQFADSQALVGPIRGVGDELVFEGVHARSRPCTALIPARTEFHTVRVLQQTALHRAGFQSVRLGLVLQLPWSFLAGNQCRLVQAIAERCSDE